MSVVSDDLPPAWQMALLSLRKAKTDDRVIFSETPAPARMAAFSLAVCGHTSQVNLAGDPLGSGRFVVLYDPEGQVGWNGTFRVISLLVTDLELSLLADPLAAEVAWSWLTETLEANNAAYSSLVGAVTCENTLSFSGFDAGQSSGRVEIRASWTPDSPDLSAHFAVWRNAMLLASGISPDENVTHLKC